MTRVKVGSSLPQLGGQVPRSVLRRSWERTLSIDELVEHVAARRAAGLEGVVVDANFWSEVDRASRRATVPDRLAPLLEAAR